MFRSRLTLAALALVLLAATASPATAADAPPDPAASAAEAARLAACSAAPAPGMPVTIDGKSGVSTSLPFTLDQTAYAVTWSLAGPSDRVTFMSLESLDATPSRSDVLVNATGDETVTGGQTAVYKIKPGHYYLHGRMPTNWSVTFTPIAI
jgi:hypothetical protein